MIRGNNSKEIERIRYNKASELKIVEASSISELAPNCVNLLFRQPYIYYHALLEEVSVKYKSGNHLDLCCGDGIHSFSTSSNMQVVAIDYSEESIKLANLKNRELKKSIDFKVADVDNLNFQNDSFDVVSIAGSLSYLEKTRVINEILRVLKPGGYFVCVDSLNNNPIYRLNRFIHFLRGNRSFSTLRRMPDLNFLISLNQKFTDTKVKYFGKILFLSFVFRLFFDLETTVKYMNKFDAKYNIPSLAFKFVFIGRKPIGNK